MVTTLVKKAKKTKKQRKYGRNAASCLRYKLSHRCERNKVKRLNKHLRRFPNDKVAIQAKELCQVVLG